MPQEIYMKANSLTIWLKVSESTSMLTVANTWAIGTKTSSTDLARRSGTTAALTKVSIRMRPKKAKENIAGLMETDMSANGVKTCLTAKVSSSGMIIDSTW